MFDDDHYPFQKKDQKNGIEFVDIFNNYCKLYKTQEELNNEFSFGLFPSR